MAPMMSPQMMAMMAEMKGRPSIMEAMSEIASREQAEQPKGNGKLKPTKKSHAGMHWALGSMAAGQAADLISTHQGLKRPGVAEGNSWLYGKDPSLGRLIGVKAATVIPAAIALDKMHDEHPKVAKALAHALGILGAALAVRNGRVGRKDK